MTTLVAKITAASLKVGALATDKRNVQQNYDYISADKILERVGDALAKQGVVIFPSIVSEVTESVATGNGKSRYDCTVHFGMIVSDGETQIELPWCGKGSDYAVPDKALYKAITSGHKYFLMKLLNVGVGNEDSEHEVPDEPKQNQVATGDVVFNTPSKPRVTKTQVDELNVLGKNFYGENEWKEQAPKLAYAVSKGATQELGELMASEAVKLIDGIKKKIADSVDAQGVSYAQTH